MGHLRSGTAFPATIRRLVALALAPAACGGSVLLTSTNDSGGGVDTQGGNHTIYEESSAPPGTPDTIYDDSAAPDAPDESAPADGSVCAVGQVANPCGRGGCFTCADTFDAGSGPCAPKRLSGTTCTGQELLFPCGLPAPALPDSAYFNLCPQYCGPGLFFCNASVNDGGTSVPINQADASWAAVDGSAGPVVMSCGVDCTGRLPESLVGAVSGCATTIGEALAQAAYLEAAAVCAFLDLATQLEVLGAPASLVRRARRAARDEVRHARKVGALARARGCAVREPNEAPSEVTDPFAIALLNAREGCVRETWGAACAVAQSRKAADPALRRLMAAIARDEIAHAALSLDIAAWLERRLTPGQRNAVNAERQRAIAELEAELRGEACGDVREDVRAALGLPSKKEAQALFTAMRTEVWAEAA